MIVDNKSNWLKNTSVVKIITWVNVFVQLLFPISLTFIPSTVVAQESMLQQSNDVKVQPYIIQSGERIDDVAKRFSMSVKQLGELNQFRIFSRGFENVKAGDEIDVPASGGGQKKIDKTGVAEKSSGVSELTGNMNQMMNTGPSLASPRSSDSASDMSRTMVSGAATAEIQHWLSQWGTSRVQINLDKKFSLDESSFDTLLPIYDTSNNTFFSQLGIRDKDGRNIVNLGLGNRTIKDDWILGVNSFYDFDFTGNNHRVGFGVEGWSNYIQVSANSYFRLNSWRQSRDFPDYNERPANGFDIRTNAWLPSFPQLGGKLGYEQYFGKQVALLDKSNLQKNPYSITAGLNYTPFPLLTLGIEQRFGKNYNNDTQLSLQLNYRPADSWKSQVNPSYVSGMRQISESRYDLVDRNNNFVFEYRKQDLISLVLSNNQIFDREYSKHLVSGQVKSKYELATITWDSDEFISAGGDVSVIDKKSFNLTLPAYRANIKDTASKSKEDANTYNINFVAIDKNGNKSSTSTLKVIVNPLVNTGSARF
ncbi:inverse autotransporter beta domain-containing protein, partial [Salmonella enterica]|nr:inverse autotransporter beta domain-containing protein [Salmonella enterica]